jgi:DnaJ-class molecular chaperone
MMASLASKLGKKASNNLGAIQFRRDGDDIVLDLPISLDEAVLGAKVETPTVSGRVALTIPKGSTSGDVLRLKGKGVPTAKGKAGDQRVVLQVMLPERIDDDLEAFFKTWRETHRYDPRAKLGRV